MPQFQFLIIITLLISTVRSDHNPIKLPSDQQNSDLCNHIGVDETRNSCPVKCFRPDPVCGVDGVTYWCGCADAHCSGTRVQKMGFCEVGNGGSGPVSGTVEVGREEMKEKLRSPY
ncbi:hypothetical protein Leryth_004657 [Lithospermum erythrorhizon]|nr:hypothetical protein Leryth_004657 [Lithospermum erythrorhizon]